jgi:hypothetical protein
VVNFNTKCRCLIHGLLKGRARIGQPNLKVGQVNRLDKPTGWPDQATVQVIKLSKSTGYLDASTLNSVIDETTMGGCLLKPA